MKITVLGRHLVITDPINDYAVKRMKKKEILNRRRIYK